MKYYVFILNVTTHDRTSIDTSIIQNIITNSIELKLLSRLLCEIRIRYITLTPYVNLTTLLFSNNA